MARRQVLIVRPRPPLQRNKLYRARVLEVRLDKRPATLTAVIEHTEAHQKGRRHQYSFELPLYPESHASRFLTACGVDADREGKRVCVDDALGVLVGLRFHTAGSEETGVTFERIQQASDRANGPVRTDPLQAHDRNHLTS